MTTPQKRSRPENYVIYTRIKISVQASNLGGGNGRAGQVEVAME